MRRRACNLPLHERTPDAHSIQSCLLGGYRVVGDAEPETPKSQNLNGRNSVWIENLLKEHAHVRLPRGAWEARWASGRIATKGILYKKYSLRIFYGCGRPQNGIKPLRCT